MKDGPRLTLVFVGRSGSPNPAGFCDGADEVIEVGETPSPRLADSPARAPRYRFIASKRGPTRRINLGLSFASGEWIVVAFGDESVPAGWLGRVIEAIEARPEAAAHLFSPVGGGAPAIVALRRTALAHGAPDERFGAERLVMIHWVALILGPQGEEVVKNGCDWIAPGWPRIPSPAAAAVELWPALGPADRSELLAQALADPAALQAELAELRDREDRVAAAGDVYRGTAVYDPKGFWEDNTGDYVKWEVFQPDEPEIMALVDRTRADSVLELGCGAGRNTRYFEGARRYAGIDLSVNLLDRGLERQGANSIGLICGDVRALPFSDASFDLVFADSTIQHVAPDCIESCVAETVRVAARYICLIEYTREAREGGKWFEQVHVFAHDYPALLAPYAKLLWRSETSCRVQPAVKEAFLFEKLGGGGA